MSVDNVLPFPKATPERPPNGADVPLLRDAMGAVLRDERTSQRRTLSDVAERAAVSLPYLSEVERGRKEVSSDLLDAICGSLGVEVADVLELTARRMRRSVSGTSNGFMMLAA